MDENPIDKDKITERPHNLEYPHHVGSPKVEKTEKGVIRSKALSAMEQQTNLQLKQIYEQMELLASQARHLQQRVATSQKIYGAEISFEPVVGHRYHLYRKKNGKYVLSMIGEKEWRKEHPFESYIAEVILLADRTWDVLKQEDEI